MYLLLILALLFGGSGGDLDGDGAVGLLDYAWVQTHDDWRETQAGLERLSVANARRNRVVTYVIADSDGRALMTCELPMEADRWANLDVDISPAGGGATIWLGNKVRVEVRRR